MQHPTHKFFLDKEFKIDLYQDLIKNLRGVMRTKFATLAFSAIFLAGTFINSAQEVPKTANPTAASSQPLPEYTAKNFDHLLGKVEGINDDLLKMHFKLYQGYVANTNKLLKAIAEMDAAGKNRDPEYAGLKHLLGWEFDGMRLHEYYFNNLGGSAPLDANTDFYKALTRNFGSFDKWKEDFVATGLMRGIGWVVTYVDPSNGRIINAWINEHDLGHLAGGTPLLIMDVFEHAYITQYGLDRAAYIDAFFKNINWVMVSGRYERFKDTNKPM